MESERSYLNQNNFIVKLELMELNLFTHLFYILCSFINLIPIYVIYQETKDVETTFNLITSSLVIMFIVQLSYNLLSNCFSNLTSYILMFFIHVIVVFIWTCIMIYSHKNSDENNKFIDHCVETFNVTINACDSLMKYCNN